MSQTHLPPHWRVVPFDDCVKKGKSQRRPSIPREMYQATGRYPVVGQGSEYVAGWTDLTESVIAEDLPVIIFGDHTRIFKYIDFPFAVGADGTKILQTKDEILDSLFFYFALLSLSVPSKGYNRHYKYLREFSIAFPSDKAEQRAIARALQAVQEARGARRREAALERERKVALMQHLFTYGLVSLDKANRLPLEETEVGLLPQHWKVTRLDSVANLVSGGTPSKQRLDWWQGEIPWASPKDLKQSRLWDTQEHISSEALQNGSRNVPAGTIFIVIRGMILAKDIPVAIAEVPMAFNQDIKAITPLTQVDAEYLLYALQRHKEALVRLIGTSAHGTRRVGTSALEAFRLPLPPTDEQREIAALLSACDAKIAALEREMAVLDELFRALLEELMTGRLSAAALIEAIMVEREKAISYEPPDKLPTKVDLDRVREETMGRPLEELADLRLWMSRLPRKLESRDDPGRRTPCTYRVKVIFSPPRLNRWTVC